MTSESAGILLHRRGPSGLEVLLIHPGGPFWRRRDAGAWQIPKGAVEAGEDAQAAAIREVREELGLVVSGVLVPLGTIRQTGGKRVTAFALDQDFDIATLVSQPFDMEWPPHSGERRSFPEVDEARWFGFPEARLMMLPSQVPLLETLFDLIGGRE